MEVENKLCPYHNTMNFEQIHWSQYFCGKYGLAVMLSIPRRTTIKNVDEITSSAQENYVLSNHCECQKTIWCTHHELHLQSSCAELVIQRTICWNILGWSKNECFWQKITCTGFDFDGTIVKRASRAFRNSVMFKWLLTYLDKLICTFACKIALKVYSRWF